VLLSAFGPETSIESDLTQTTPPPKEKARPVGRALFARKFTLYIQNIKLSGAIWTFAELYIVNEVSEIDAIVWVLPIDKILGGARFDGFLKWWSETAGSSNSLRDLSE
jgi:hypothetical protein